MTDIWSWDIATLAAQPTAPGAGANYAFTVAAKKKYRLYSLVFKFDTDSSAADRVPTVSIDKGSGVPVWEHTFEKATSDEIDYFYIAHGYTNSDAADQDFRTQAMPPFIQLETGDRILITIAAKEAGDQITPRWIMLEGPA